MTDNQPISESIRQMSERHDPTLRTKLHPARKDPRLNHNTDKVALGLDILPNKVDGRTSFVKRIRSYYDLIIYDLGGHDNPQLSTLQKGVAKGCAALLSAMDEMLMNKANGEYMEGEPWDLKMFQETEKAYTHLARQIGYNRQAKTVIESDLKDIVKDIKAKKPILKTQT